MLIIVIDLLAYYASLLLAYGARKYILPHVLPTPPFTFTLAYHLALWWIPAVLLAFMVYERLYTKRFPFWLETARILKALTAGTLVVLSLVTLGKMSAKISRLVLISLWFLSLFLFPLFHYWGKRLLAVWSLGQEKILILGAGNAGKAFAQGLERERTMGYRMVGFLDDDPHKIGKEVNTGERGYPVLGPLKDLKDQMERHGVQTIAIAMPSLGAQGLRDLVKRVYLVTHQVLLVPELKGITLLNAELITLFMEQLFVLRIRNNLKSPLNRFVKRTFDLVVGILLLMVLSPFTALLALVISIESPGGPFFIQKRWGRKGVLFNCMKFRSMYVDGDDKLQGYLDSHDEAKREWEEFKKLRDYDPRVTKVGRFLRKTSLDELPQFLHVITGKMSLVGPRPYLPREREDMGEYFATIMVSKPGITGLWQVSGRNILPFKDRLLLDTWYVQNWSLWLDIVILFKTVQVLIRREGAY